MNLKHTIKAVLNRVRKEGATISMILSLLAIVGTGYNIYLLKTTGGVAINATGTVKAEEPKKILKDLPKNAPVIGSANAKVTMIEFGDFQCPFCGRFFNQMFPTIKKEYIDTGKIKFIYMDFAFLGPESKDAAEAARCAQEQGKFWEYHDELYKNQKGENLGAFNPTKLKEFASNIRLDSNAFATCVEANKYDKMIEEELELGKKYGVRGTPNFLIGEQFKGGAGTVDSLRQVIDAELKKHE